MSAGGVESRRVEASAVALHDGPGWESATPDRSPSTGLAKRFTNPRLAFAFARIVTHCVRYDLWLEERCRSAVATDNDICHPEPATANTTE